MVWVILAIMLVIVDLIIMWACLHASAKADASQEWAAREVLHMDEQQLKSEADMLREAMEEENW